MSEIKSTLDLIMERTKDLTLSDDEKREIEQKEERERLRGLIQRSMDGTLAPAEFDRELTAAIEKDPDFTKDALRTETIERLDPDQDNDRLLDILDQYVGVRKDVCTEKLDRFRSRAAAERKRREEPLRDGLAAAGIRGNAVIPNIGKDPQWQSWYAEADDQLKRELRLIRGS